MNGAGGVGTGGVDQQQPPSTEALSKDDRELVGLTTKTHPVRACFEMKGYGCSRFALPRLRLTRVYDVGIPSAVVPTGRTARKWGVIFYSDWYRR